MSPSGYIPFYVIISLLVISAGQKTNRDTRLDHVFIYVPISSVISGKAHSDIRVGKRRHRTGKKMTHWHPKFYHFIRITGQALLTAPASLASAVTSGTSQRIDAATKSAS